MKIGKVCMMVEIDGRVCAVVLPQDKMLILVDLASSLSDSGKLPVREMGDSYKFETIEAL
ncbi:hypothetical protein KAI46_05200 [bacterium]|nr:hypothetical protein [bacterium]